MGTEADLSLASMDPNLPYVDLHGLIRDAVPYEVGMLIARNPNTCVRVVYGHGKGILKDAVTEFLTVEKQKGSIADFSHEMSGASCVIKTT